MSPPMAERLSEAQRRLLQFMQNGGDVIVPSPGWNEEYEFQYSRLGVGLFVDADEAVTLLRRGQVAAKQRNEVVRIDDEVECTHSLIITDAGRRALAEADGASDG